MFFEQFFMAYREEKKNGTMFILSLGQIRKDEIIF